jgi:hypothetical protein
MICGDLHCGVIGISHAGGSQGVACRKDKARDEYQPTPKRAQTTFVPVLLTNTYQGRRIQAATHAGYLPHSLRDILIFWRLLERVAGRFQDRNPNFRHPHLSTIGLITFSCSVSLQPVRHSEPLAVQVGHIYTHLPKTTVTHSVFFIRCPGAASSSATFVTSKVSNVSLCSYYGGRARTSTTTRCLLYATLVE